MKLSLIFFLISNLVFCQSQVEKMMIEADQAFLNHNFNKAEELYLKVIEITPNHKTAWFNLGVTKINLNEVESGCECFYQAYLHKEKEAESKIREFCPNFRNGTIKHIYEVDERPKFVFKDELYDLFVDDVLNPMYLKILKKEIKKSKVLKTKLGKGNTLVEFTINQYGIFETTFLRISANAADYQIIENEFNAIFRRTAKYIPAKFNGKSVDLWEKWVLPLSN
jgi:tetratricopeptide (TPR) repeat protein